MELQARQHFEVFRARHIFADRCAAANVNLSSPRRYWADGKCEVHRIFSVGVSGLVPISSDLFLIEPENQICFAQACPAHP